MSFSGFHCRVFSPDVTAAMLVSLNKWIAAMLVSPMNPPGIELYSYADAFFCFGWNTCPLITRWNTTKWTFLACTFCIPISDHVMFSWEFFFCLFISYAYMCTCTILFPRVASRGVKWENNRYKLKRFIIVVFCVQELYILWKGKTIFFTSLCLVLTDVTPDDYRAEIPSNWGNFCCDYIECREIKISDESYRCSPSSKLRTVEAP